MRCFVSYRRKENVQRAMNLAAVLRKNFGEDSVFLDTEDTLLGEPYPDRLLAEMRRADTVIALIGPEWLAAKDDAHRRRIDLSTDWVRTEILMALQDNKLLVPTYVGGGRQLSPDQLLEDIRPIATLLSLELRDNHHWNDDVVALIRRLRGNGTHRGEVRWPQNAAPYNPEPLGPLRIQEMMNALPAWHLHEFEVDSGAFKGHRGSEVKRSLEFKTFLDAIEFMQTVANFVNAMGHHPRWENVWKTVTVRLSSWDVGHKLSDREYILAKHIDRAYRLFEARSSDSG